MKELLQGRRFGFAPRPAVAFIAVGIGIALTLSDLMAWFAWGSRQTNGFVVVADWLALTATVVLGVGILTSLAEYLDAPEDDRGIARLDLLATIVAFLLYGASAFLRGLDTGAAATPPAPFLLAVAGLIVTLVDAAVAANLYSAREWEELEEEPMRERRQRRRAAGR
ncbi:MAG TPA: hypothetical protein VGR87_13845 [Candidatus Limnocylindria bacterium]|nr:hypothetical protein [Candidatus Limnocylindria bacterium]